VIRPADETLLDTMVRAVVLVRERLLRATKALQSAGIPYAVVGGNAVAAWVATIDPTATRNTQDVDILLRRADIEAAAQALAAVGFVRRHVAGMDMFLDGPSGRARDAVHAIPANEKIRPEYAISSPDVTDAQVIGPFRLLSLEALVKMKLTSFLDKDRVHLRDLLDVGLVDATWTPRLPSELAARLQELIDTPES
jgi:hypothetical protein